MTKLICLLLLCASVWAQDVMVIRRRAAATACSGANTYVGGSMDTSGTSTEPWNGYWVRQDGAQAWSIGGSGTVTICAIQAYGRNSDTSAGITARLAVYDASNNLVCQGSSTYTINTDTTLRWYGHTYGVDLSGTCTLDKSATYRIGFTSNDAKAQLHKTTGASGVSKYGATSYASGWAASLSGGTSHTSILTLRVGYQ